MNPQSSCVSTPGCSRYQRGELNIEAVNGLMQQAKCAARGFRTAANFIAFADLRLGRLTHLSASPFVPATALSDGATPHRA